MDAVIIEYYEQLVNQHHCSVDTLLITPALREQFLTRARASCPEQSEPMLLGRLLALRKRGVLTTTR